LRINREVYGINVSLNLHEALGLYLLAMSMDHQNQHVATAVRKLGTALKMVGPPISTYLQQSAAVRDAEDHHYNKSYLQVLETLTVGWAELRKVRIFYYQYPAARYEKYLFSPYFIDWSTSGNYTYSIGWREPPNALRAVVVEHLDRAELTNEHYLIPPEFEAYELLAEAQDT